jgi:hypothetical protein
VAPIVDSRAEAAESKPTLFWFATMPERREGVDAFAQEVSRQGSLKAASSTRTVAVIRSRADRWRHSSPARSISRLARGTSSETIEHRPSNVRPIASGSRKSRWAATHPRSTASALATPSPGAKWRHSSYARNDSADREAHRQFPPSIQQPMNPFHFSPSSGSRSS